MSKEYNDGLNDGRLLESARLQEEIKSIKESRNELLEELKLARVLIDTAIEKAQSLKEKE